MHWLVVAFCLLQPVYRPTGWPGKYVAYGPLFLLLLMYNALVHYRLAANRTITWNWMLGLDTVNLVSRFERARWGRAVERVRALQRERIEF